MTPTQVFSCKYHKMFEKSYFYGMPPVAASENDWKISKNFYRRSDTERFVWFDYFGHANCKIVATFCITICMIRFLKDCVSSFSSDLYEEILKPSKAHTNHIIQIVPCKTTLMQNQKDLYRRIYEGERFVKTFCSNWRNEIK